MIKISTRLQDNTIPKKLAKYLSTSGNKEDDMPPSINTRINSEKEMKMFLLADFLGEQGVKSAEDMHESLCQHAVSKRGYGRAEVVQAITSVPSVPVQGASPGFQYGEDEE